MTQAVLDFDNDGLLDYLDSDSDNDGSSDGAEGIEDDDDDGIPNYLDNGANENDPAPPVASGPEDYGFGCQSVPSGLPAAPLLLGLVLGFRRRRS